MMKDPVRSKPWLAIAAIVSTLLAMLSAPGLLCFFGVPFVDMAAAMPFIIIGKFTKMIFDDTDEKIGFK